MTDDGCWGFAHRAWGFARKATTPQAGVGFQETKHQTPNTKNKTPNTGLRSLSYDPAGKTRNTSFNEQNTKHQTPNTSFNIQNTNEF